MSVSKTACGASVVEFANVYASQAVTARHATVSVMIQPGERSRSRSSSVAVAFDERSVLIKPSATGLASVASVHIADTPMAPAPRKRTCVRQIIIVCVANDAASAAGCMNVRIGTAPAHAIRIPTPMAIPTDSPTR